MTDRFGSDTGRFHAGPGGFLLDRNGDGLADDVALRIVLPHGEVALPGEIWRALVDLAGRVGLETAGLPDAIVLESGEPAPPKALLLSVLPDEHPRGRRSSLEETPGTIVVQSAAEIVDLLRSAESTKQPEGPGDQRTEPLGDLAELFENGGLLVDRDGDLLPDGTRLCIRLPDPCPREIGIAAIEFAARVGMESSGIDLPIGMTAGEPAPHGAIMLDLNAAPASDLTSGQGRLRLENGGLRVDGDSPGIAALLRYLAVNWPSMGPTSVREADLRLSLEVLRDVATAGNSLGRVAAFLVEAERIPNGSTVRVPTADAVDYRLLTGALPQDTVVESNADGDIAFVLDWEDTWEVDRARELLLATALPRIAASDATPLDLLIAVSESRSVRQEFEREVRRLIAESASDPDQIRVRVRSAYKLGLSWLREDVIPTLEQLGGIDRVEIHYTAYEPQSGDSGSDLDLRIRWLQELYPGDELLSAALGLPLSAIDLVERANAAEVYEVRAFAGDQELWRDAISPFSYYLPYVSLQPDLGRVVASTGGIRLRADNRLLFEQATPTDNDRFWHWFQGDVLPTVATHVHKIGLDGTRAEQQPFFDMLEVDVWISEPNEALGIREELDSAAEALHEDVYFGALDWFMALGEQQCGTPYDAPGAIVPLIHLRTGAPSARVTLRERRRFSAELVTPDGARTVVGRIDDLPVPRFTVTGLTVAGDSAGRARLTGLDIRCMVPEGADIERTARMMRAVAPLLEQEATSTAIPARIRLGLASPVAILLSIPSSDLSGAEPALEPAIDTHIVWEDALPPLLARLDARPGVSAYRAGRSYRGRPMWVAEIVEPMQTARWSAAKLGMQKPTLLVVARHHANEVSSTTAAFLLAERLTIDPDWSRLRRQVNVVIVPFENPDGAALHRRLVEEHPTWKHHAARYNAVGFEFQAHFGMDETPYGEARVRPMLGRRWRPDVVVDNHGVPSHEWTQHFAGFGSSPRFPVSYWMVQALLYGIINRVDHPDRMAFAETLRDRLAAELRRHADLNMQNEIYLDRYHRWGTSRVPDRFPAEIYDGFLCYMTKSSADLGGKSMAAWSTQSTTLDWITEVPDETVHGAQLSATARAHLLANRVTLDLIANCDTQMTSRSKAHPDGKISIVRSRRRPLVIRSAER